MSRSKRGETFTEVGKLELNQNRVNMNHSSRVSGASESA